MPLIATFLIFYLAAGCAVAQSSERSAPAPHPLLVFDKVKPTAASSRRAPHQRATQSRALAKNLERIRRAKRFGAESNIYNFLRAAYIGHGALPQLNRVETRADLLAATTPIHGPIYPGDIVLFQRGQSWPSLGIIEEVVPPGQLKVFTLHRGKAQTIYAHIHYRSWRRRGGRIINSFLRKKSPGDATGTPYLAGQLITHLRRLPAATLER